MPPSPPKGFITGLKPENCSATSCLLFQLFLSFNNYSLIVLCDKIVSVLKHFPSGLLTIKDPVLPANSVKLKIKALPQKGFNTCHIGNGFNTCRPGRAVFPPAYSHFVISAAGQGVGGATVGWNYSLLKRVYRTHEGGISHSRYLLWISNLVPQSHKTCLLLLSGLQDSFSLQIGTSLEVP